MVYNGDGPRAFGQKALPYLMRLAHGSAPFISTFLLIHLAAPAVANIGGSSLASQTMLLGREYYQTGFGEKYLILGPLAVHALSGIAKRVLSPSGKPPRPCTSLLSMTGYAAVFFFVPIHFMTHRVHPTSLATPILAVGPAELDYEFVKVALRTWPWRSWFLYAGLVGTVVIHSVDGATLIWNTWLKDTFAGSWKNRNRSRRILLAIGALVVPVLTGIFMLSTEPLYTFTSKVKQYEAVLNSSWYYRI